MLDAQALRVENPRVGGSIPPLGTIPSRLQRILELSFPTKTPISYKIYNFVAHDGGDLANARKQKTAIKKLRLSLAT